MTLQLQVYNSELANFIKAVEGAEYVDFLPEIPIEEMIDDYKTEKPKEKETIKTGIIQSLYEILKRCDELYQRISKPQFNGNLRHDNALRDEIDYFYSDVCQMLADEILQHIHLLIQLDGYDTRIFGAWKLLARAIRESKGQKKCMLLNQLRITALTTIPTDLRYEQVEIIAPSITHQSRTVRG